MVFEKTDCVRWWKEFDFIWLPSFPISIHIYPFLPFFFRIFLCCKAGKLLGPILVAAVQTAAEQILQSFVVPGSSLMSTHKGFVNLIWNVWAKEEQTRERRRFYTWQYISVVLYDLVFSFIRNCLFSFVWCENDFTFGSFISIRLTCSPKKQTQEGVNFFCRRWNLCTDCTQPTFKLASAAGQINNGLDLPMSATVYFDDLFMIYEYLLW